MTEVTSSGLEGRVDALEPPYRSRGEARVGRVLDRYGIPFFYEQPTLIYDRGRYRLWRPDFTLPQHNGLVVEYAGMMDVPDYARGIAHKQQAFAANSIVAHFVYPWDLREPNWPDQLVERLGAAGILAGPYGNRGNEPSFQNQPYGASR